MTTNYQDPRDLQVAEWLRQVGKTKHCICEIESHDADLPWRRPSLELHKSFRCPVHFPESSAILTGARS